MEDAINYIKQLERRIETLERFSGGGGSDSGWISLSLVNSWVQYDTTYGVPAYRKVGNIVYLKGLIKNGSSAVIATLPAGYRPTERFLGVSNNYPNVSCRIDVDTDGVIQLNSSYSNSWVSLWAISFIADA